MANENEAIADIIAEMRRREKSHYYPKVARNVMHQYANRTEAAWKREREELERYATSKMLDGATIVDNRGNAAAMREALIPWISLGEWLIQNAGKDALGQGIAEIVSKLRARVDASRAALSSPPRQCDIGTAEEQAERFARYCGTEVCKRKRCKTRPKALVIDACALCWAQMPYEAEEGGAK